MVPSYQNERLAKSSSERRDQLAETQDLPHMSATGSGSSSETFHSITLDSLPPRQSQTEQLPPSSPIPPTPAPVVAKPDSPRIKYQRSFENHTAPLPEFPAWHTRNAHDNMTAPLPQFSTSTTTLVLDLITPLRDPDDLPSPEDKFGVSLYPTLPAPMPLRKSIRTPRDPSMGTGPLGGATPRPPGGKRTSWLTKERLRPWKAR